jgi:hypothetical protein
MPKHHHSFGRESIVTGLIGASVVALWFLILDAVNGQPLSTPSILGQVIIFGEQTPVAYPTVYPAVAAYTALHLAGFLLVGAILTKLFFLADRHNIVRFALLVFFLAFEVFFYGMITAFFQGTRGYFPFWAVLVANTLAAAAMGFYLFRIHPAFRRGLAREPLGS